MWCTNAFTLSLNRSHCTYCSRSSRSTHGTARANIFKHTHGSLLESIPATKSGSTVERGVSSLTSKKLLNLFNGRSLLFSIYFYQMVSLFKRCILLVCQEIAGEYTGTLKARYLPTPVKTYKFLLLELAHLRTPLSNPDQFSLLNFCH